MLQQYSHYQKNTGGCFSGAADSHTMKMTTCPVLSLRITMFRVSPLHIRGFCSLTLINTVHSRIVSRS